MSLRIITALILLVSSVNFVMADQDPIGEHKQVKLKPVRMPGELAQTLLKEMLRSGFTLPPELRRDYRRGRLKATEFFSAYEVKLSKNGDPVLFIRQNESNSLCTGQNCPMWVYQKQNEGFNRLLSSDIGYFDLTVLKRTSNGYHDLLVVRHASAAEHELTIYSFNGKVYRAKKCFTETVERDAEGNAQYKYQQHKCD